MSSYLTIEKSSKAEFVVKDSKFISLLFPCNSKDEFENIFKSLRKEYSKATHYCFAYILDENHYYYSDDGEPNGTAGIRIYSALKYKNLSRCALFVIRYFGGTKLGVGPLAKAYFDVSMMVIRSAQILEKFITKEAKIIINYDQLDRVKKMLKEFTVYEPQINFSDKVEVKFYVEPAKIIRLVETLAKFNILVHFQD